MAITKQEALKIVTAVEDTADYYDGPDYAEGVVGAAMSKLAGELAEALGVPRCTCHWGHGSRGWGQRPDEVCPRDGFGDDE